MSDPIDTEHWQREPDKHDFPAAKTYLSLIAEPSLAEKLVKLLEHAPTSTYEVKDLLRASRLPLLEETNKHVAIDLDKVKRGEKLSPVLLVEGVPLWVADGYHRICVSYHLNEKEPVPCRIVPR